MAANELYQYSTMSALMDGVASRGIPLARLLVHGDHGLGTFRHMAGELIVADGRAWRMKHDGTVDAVDAADTTVVSPFAAVTLFRPTLRARVDVVSKTALALLLARLLPAAHNLFVAVRLDGVVGAVTVRTTAGQQHLGQRLAEVGAGQVALTFSGPGTVVGFRSPEFVQGIGVAGLHLHFISADERHGGHVLALEAQELELSAAVISAMRLELPVDDPDFNAAELRPDLGVLAHVEG